MIAFTFVNAHFYLQIELSRRKWGNVKRNFSSVSQGVYIANMVIFLCIKLIFGVNTFKKVNIHFTFK